MMVSNVPIQTHSSIGRGNGSGLLYRQLAIAHAHSTYTFIQEIWEHGAFKRVILICCCFLGGFCEDENLYTYILYSYMRVWAFGVDMGDVGGWIESEINDIRLMRPFIELRAGCYTYILVWDWNSVGCTVIVRWEVGGGVRTILKTIRNAVAFSIHEQARVLYIT